MFSSFNARAVGLMNLSAEETVDLAARVGFDGVDILVRDLIQSGVAPKLIRRKMDDHGLRGGAFPFPFDWRGDEATFRRDLEGLAPIAEAARIIGLRTTGTWVMPALPEPASNRRAVASLHVERLGLIARKLDEFGIRLGLEVIGVETFWSDRGEPFVGRLAALDRELAGIWDQSPNLGIVLDAFHLHAADEPIEAGLAWGIDRVVWAHLADLPTGGPVDRSRIIDSDRGLPGDNGAVDARGFLTRLAIEGYDGPITVEPLANCRSLTGLSPIAVADRVKRSLDAVWPAD